MATYKRFNLADSLSTFYSDSPLPKDLPLIGITGNYNDGNTTLSSGYYQSVLKSGGIPVIIPTSEQTDSLTELLEHLDGLILSGGADINPLYMNEEPIKELHTINPLRDQQELLLVRLAADRQIPILGICRGEQIMNVALGGTLYQDIYSQMPGSCIKHSQDLDRAYASHTITICHKSILHDILQTDRLAVNSFHHQAVCEPAPGFCISARSCDGVAEAIENTEGKSMLGVQWHPECFILNGDEYMLPLFQWLITEARSFKQAKQLHQRILTLDSHCDTPMFFGQDINFATRDPLIKVDLHKMYEGHQDATIMVAYLKQEERTESALQNATAKANRLLDQIEDLVKQNRECVEIAYTPADLYRLKQQGKKGIMLGIENGYAIGKDLDNIEHFRKRGVVYMTLCHNGNNDICGSARYNDMNLGLSDFGEKVILEMNRVGMMIDLSHAGERSFYDVLSISRDPVVCSHSSSRAICNHPRNLTDDQLRYIAKNGGVVQLCLYSGFLRLDGRASLQDAVTHLHHMVNIMGVEHVGIGSDFDGDGGIAGCNDSSELINFTRKLLAERYSPEDISGIWGGNFLRIMHDIQK